MAEGLIYKCSHCSKSIESWSDGNPYYLDELGQKQYAYHPDHESLAKCIGNDSPHLCLNCGEEFIVDSRTPIDHCPSCMSKKISDTNDLENKKCPYCDSGSFIIDPTSMMIS